MTIAAIEERRVQRSLVVEIDEGSDVGVEVMPKLYREGAIVAWDTRPRPTRSIWKEKGPRLLNAGLCSN
jgi:hypothetical protein